MEAYRHTVNGKFQRELLLNNEIKTTNLEQYNKTISINVLKEIYNAEILQNNLKIMPDITN